MLERLFQWWFTPALSEAQVYKRCRKTKSAAQAKREAKKRNNIRKHK